MNLSATYSAKGDILDGSDLALFEGAFGLGYAGLDYFSPELTYRVEDQPELAFSSGAL